MFTGQYDVKTINFGRETEKADLREFLAGEDLSLDGDIDYAVCLFEGDRIIASGCAASNVLKCIAVAAPYQGQQLTNRIMSLLRIRAYHEGFPGLFLFTKDINEAVFRDLGFFPLARAPGVILMEDKEEGWRRYLEELNIPEGERGTSAALVMNCNPFTLGHRYLVEMACRENDRVHLFLVKENLSVFPYDVRLKLVREGTADLDNLSIHEGRDYIISHATFPTYFIKEKKVINESHARIDLDIFSRLIAPELGIVRRYVGEEPYCPVTSLYNRIMEEMLPGRGIEVVTIPRKEAAGGAVSATKVRKALAEEDWDTLEGWVPPTTLRFLQSEDGRRIGNLIRKHQEESE
ncbi:MAG: [citrate (pro-3S)-lyase] ligase [Spirochaetales bacterium]|nr:[citrate (pro-3S)-lyase] ligase [Spirochaetales bacterium]